MHRSALLTLTVLSTIVLTAMPANAAGRTFSDPRGDTSGGASGNDIVSTKVVNGAMVGVKIRHRRLGRSVVDIQFKAKSADGSVATVFGSFASGSVMVYGEDFTPIECSGAKLTRSLKKDRTALMVPAICLPGDTSTVKLRPRVQWNNSGSKGDWSFNKGDHFSPVITG